MSPWHSSSPTTSTTTRRSRGALGGRRLGLAGHGRVRDVLGADAPAAAGSPAGVGGAELLAANFPGTRHLSSAGADELLARLGALGIVGGSVCDALVAATAREHRLVLATRDRRALDIYRALDAEIEVVPDR